MSAFRRQKEDKKAAKRRQRAQVRDNKEGSNKKGVEGSDSPNIPEWAEDVDPAHLISGKSGKLPDIREELKDRLKVGLLCWFFCIHSVLKAERKANACEQNRTGITSSTPESVGRHNSTFTEIQSCDSILCYLAPRTCGGRVPCVMFS